MHFINLHVLYILYTVLPSGLIAGISKTIERNHKQLNRKPLFVTRKVSGAALASSDICGIYYN